MSKYDLFNKHHIVPRSKWWSNIDDNLIKIPIQVHNAIHLLFQNRTPAEQIKSILKINEKALTKDFKQSIFDIIRLTETEYIYNNWILLWTNDK